MAWRHPLEAALKIYERQICHYGSSSLEVLFVWQYRPYHRPWIIVPHGSSISRIAILLQRKKKPHEGTDRLEHSRLACQSASSEWRQALDYFPANMRRLQGKRSIGHRSSLEAAMNEYETATNTLHQVKTKHDLQPFSIPKVPVLELLVLSRRFGAATNRNDMVLRSWYDITKILHNDQNDLLNFEIQEKIPKENHMVRYNMGTHLGWGGLRRIRPPNPA